MTNVKAKSEIIVADTGMQLHAIEKELPISIRAAQRGGWQMEYGELPQLLERVVAAYGAGYRIRSVDPTPTGQRRSWGIVEDSEARMAFAITCTNL